ncbi:DUF1178 family protein [Desulfobacterales bacterium HSG16]|nr:DUF1178 family protein [Desulfobacterales bacterium HSG16]
MIIFDLQCSNGHGFEGWFEDTEAFENQNKKRLIACPVCNDTDVSRVPSTFAIKSSGRQEKELSETPPDKNLPADPVDIGNKLMTFIDNNFDNVGCDFAKEALKIHYGASEPRNIRGVSTDKEEEMLKEEGIDFFKVPSSAPTETEN